MYYQIIDVKTQKVVMTVPSFQDAQRVLALYQRGEVSIMPIEKSEHPLRHR